MKKDAKHSPKGSSRKSRKTSPIRLDGPIAKAMLGLARNERAAKTRKSEIALIRELYKAVYHETESFEKKNIGADLAYLVGAIVNDSICIWPANEPLLQLLMKNFPKTHQLWTYLAVEE